MKKRCHVYSYVENNEMFHYVRLCFIERSPFFHGIALANRYKDKKDAKKFAETVDRYIAESLTEGHMMKPSVKTTDIRKEFEMLPSWHGTDFPMFEKGYAAAEKHYLKLIESIKQETAKQAAADVALDWIKNASDEEISAALNECGDSITYAINGGRNE